ncbi:HPr family phosphocarrier protein [Nocardia acidivorans]|uniref:HPr family phosphocarrier protein n=1 Tax=Nocardia acidivorans TaxID=404580 RepID=UPI000829A3B0|nr:HPr family phosphocarrier protein [Nocardia acidivorans]
MPTITVPVGSAVGLHARPANIIAETVQAAGIPVTLAIVDGTPVDAGSALMIMTLGASKGTEVTITTDDQPTLDRIAELVAADLDA